MGKGEDDTATILPQSPPSNAHSCCFSSCDRIARLFRFKCVFVLILGVSVLLSAVFWLPPFIGRGDQGDLDLDSRYKGHDIVATFMIQKPLSLLQDDYPRLAGDIFDEIRVPTTKVVILKAERNDISNTTTIIFGVDPDEYSSDISSYARSLVRDYFVSLVLKQPPLRLTESMFGEPSSFEVLKFVGGITVTPDQSVYPLQKVQIQFNFTLNFSIQQILDHFGELTNQLKSGLHLDPSSENLHVSLTNSRGSTVAPQTIVQSSVVLVVGTPSISRSKQLAQTIKGSPTKNLGLNNTQFGRVKQISLSSYFNSSSGGNSGSPTPSPAPLPPQSQRNHHHHHHHDKQMPPAKPPSPSKHSPAPHNNHRAMPPDCHSGYNRKKKNPNKHPPLFPPVSQPVPPPHPHPHHPPPLRSLPPPPRLPPPPPTSQPSHHPPPPPPVTEMIPASGPLPNVVFAHNRPPSKSDSDADHPPDMSPSSSFGQHSSVCGGLALALRTIMTFVAFIILQQK